MSWGIIKKAINSTLGTSNFKPLDRIFADGIEGLKNKIASGGVVAGKAKTLSAEWVDLVSLTGYRSATESHGGLPAGSNAEAVYLVRIRYASKKGSISAVSYHTAYAVASIGVEGSVGEAVVRLTNQNVSIAASPTNATYTYYINAVSVMRII